MADTFIKSNGTCTYLQPSNIDKVVKDYIEWGIAGTIYNLWTTEYNLHTYQRLDE